MLAEVVIIPSAPLLVPELSGPAAVETEPVRAAVTDAVTRLADITPTWIAIGADDEHRPRRGFAAFGADLDVSLGADQRPIGADAEDRLPLSMLIAAWARQTAQDRTGVAIRIRPEIIAPDSAPTACAERGAQIGRLLDSATEPIGVLVVADGATALSPSAPGGGERSSAVALQQRWDAALAAADRHALEDLDPVDCRAEGVGGRAAVQVVAGAIGSRAMTACTTYAAAPFGVGYTVCRWEPES
ncbi:hypothetical protein [Gordonia shandongensis]|uniref:hypothetical protein n=1 Tax=Gordonia shandongensis TaxID=376351 RepID=UPI000421F9E3|nr:hypothetical protein [Gordonia shandongensis]